MPVPADKAALERDLLRDRAYTTLRDAIVDGTLQPTLRRFPTVLGAVAEAVLGGRIADRLGLGELIFTDGPHDDPGPAAWVTGAALLMANIQASLRTRLALGQDLAAIAREIDVDVEDNTPGPVYATLFMGILDPVSRELTYVNAGHNWPVLRHASGAIERLEAGGLPLGINSAVSYEFGSAVLGADDLLLIFTDGLVEAEDDGEREYGEERMLPVVRTLHSGTAKEALDHIMSSVDAFVGLTRQHDDITCLVLRMT